jgi:hypothetical protein
MLKSKLRIAKHYPRETIGICEACNTPFKSYLPQPDKAAWEIQTRFDEHKCKQRMKVNAAEFDPDWSLA